MTDEPPKRLMQAIVRIEVFGGRRRGPARAWHDHGVDTHGVTGHLISRSARLR
jgi:hypothetical protein